MGYSSTNGTVPNYINYRLGALPGSPCDTIQHVGIAAQQEKQVKVYPNPAQDKLYIELPTHTQLAAFVLYDMAGKAVWQQEIQGKKTEVGVGKLGKGLYLYEVFMANGKEYGKLLIE
jgi:Secretion system C-terminal sorting domain